MAALVYTPEGQQQIAEIREILTQIVDAVSEGSKPATAIHMVGAVRHIGEQAMEVWQQQKQARIEALFRGEGMNSAESNAYLVSVLGHESNPMTRNDAENQERRRLLEQFDR